MKHARLLITLILFFSFVFPQNTRYVTLRKNMVEKQIHERGITDQRVLDAFLKVKRHLFVKPEFRKNAYGDSPIPIGEGETISPPYFVAIMTYVIAPEYNKRVLEIGTGSGYHAAILAELVKQVFSIEKEEKLAKKAKKHLLSLGYKNIQFKTGNGFLGWEEYAPYDGIIVTCSPDHIPAALINQLSAGGRMVIPVSYSSEVHELILIEKDKEGNLKKTNLMGVQFKPLIKVLNEK